MPGFAPNRRFNPPQIEYGDIMAPNVCGTGYQCGMNRDGSPICCYPSQQVQRILQGAQVPGTTKRQRRAIRHMHRQHPSCPPEAPFRCRNGLCVKDWTYCPDKLYR